MAGRHFLSVLGTGNYSEARYVCEEGAVTTSYIQEAVLKLKMLKEGYREGDRITIFVTEGSRDRNWFDRDYTEQELASRKPGEEVVRKAGLYSVLQREYGVGEEAGRLIPLGATEDELWDIFNIIYDEIQEGEELYVDITHSLRNIPIQMLSVIAYARTLKNVSVAGIYYGAFEAGKKNEDGLTEAPIFDLVTFLDILDWSQAAGSFVKYGNSDEIKALFDQHKARHKSKMADSSQVVNHLTDITQGLETSRGYRIPDRKGVQGGSVLESCRLFENAYDTIQKNTRKQAKERPRKDRIDPLGKLFGVIHDRLRVFNVDNNLDFGFAAIDWAIANKKTQQGFTALDETIKTYLCCRYKLNERIEQYREGICKLACYLVNNEIQINREARDDFTQEIREEVFRKWKVEWKRRWCREVSRKDLKLRTMTEEQEEEAARKLIMELPCKLAVLSDVIGSRRNSMNHFGYSNINQFGCKNLYKDLETCYSQFKEIIRMMEGEESG